MKSFLPSLHKLDRSFRQRTKTISQKGLQPAQFRSRTAAKVAVAALTLSLGLFAMAKPSEAATTTLSFDQPPTLVSGTDLTQGAVYRFPSVVTGIDAMVQVETIQNAQLKIIDSNAAFPARFQPTIAPTAAALTNATSYVKFNFKLIPSSTPSGTSFATAPAATATNVYFSSQDTDGNGGTNAIREFVEVIGALTSYIANPTLLQPLTPIASGTGFEVANSSNVQSGIGTDDRYEVYSFLGESVSTFSIIGGNKTGSVGCPLNNTGCDRQNSWSFNVSDIQKLDFGDAPLAFGNAFHPVPPSPTVRLGASVDGDDQPSYTAAADGDGADDNGVASFPTLTTANTNYSLNLTCAGTNAAVAGWIDFNKNNTFDVGEKAAGTCNGTTVTLNWSGLTGVVAGNTYARLRISSTASEVTNPIGQASNGEVEDYPVSIVAPVINTCPNLITGEFQGGFGTINSTTRYRNLQSLTPGYTYRVPTNLSAGEYIVTSAAYGSQTWNGFGQNITGHTTGAVDDAFLLVNGSTSIGTFYQQTINVQPNRNLEVSVWARNWAGLAFSANPPTITLGVYAANGTTLLGSSTVSNISNASAWVQALATINTGLNNQIVVRLQNLSIQFGGNDFAIDDFSVRSAAVPCLDGVAAKANVLLVKRITAINGIRTGLNSFVDDVTATPQASNDNNCNWLGATGSAGACTNTYTLGATSSTAPKIKPGDEIEYTIYYLNAGANKAKQARICDQLSSNLTFQGDTPTTPATTAPLDIRLFPGSAGPLESLTNSTDTDKGQLTTAALATSCNLAGNTGTNPSDNVVIVDVATPTNPLLGSTGAGIPTTSYGYIRFKTTVK